MMNASAWLTAGGVVVACCALFFTTQQLRLNRKIARAQFFFNIDRAFREHAAVEVKFRGEWLRGGPDSLEEWMEVEEYMGLFERIQVMVQDGMIDLVSFNRIYGYKLFYVVDNKKVYDEKLVRRGHQWELFNELWHSLEALKRDPELYPDGCPLATHADTPLANSAGQETAATRHAEPGAAADGAARSVSGMAQVAGCRPAAELGRSALALV